MDIILTEEHISRKLKKTYQPGLIASMDGYAELYEERHVPMCGCN